MTVANTVIKARHIGNSVATSFAYSFNIPTVDDYKLLLLDTDTGVETEITSNYTISGIGDDNGGSVTYPVTGDPISDRYVLTIKLDMAYTQPTQLPRQGRYSPPAVEAALDRLARLVLQLLEASARSVQLPETTALSSISLPTPEAGKGLTWNAAEDGLENTPVVLPSDVTVPATWQTLIEGTSTIAAILAGLGIPAYKLDATTAPTTGDDSDDGFGVGSMWLDVTGDAAYVCVDPTVDAAVWRKIGASTALFSDAKSTLTAGMAHTLYEDPGGTVASPRTSGTFQLDLDNGMQQRTTIGNGTVTIAAPADFSSTVGGYMEVLIEIDTATPPTINLTGFEKYINGTMDLTDNALNLLRISSIGGYDSYELVQLDATP